MDNIRNTRTDRDESVYSILRDEMERCREIVHRIERELECLPKGSIMERKVKYGNKVYRYPCLKHREGEKVICEHISASRLETVQEAIEKRRRFESDRKANLKRIATIVRLLGR